MSMIYMKLSDKELTEKLREFLRFEPLIQWLFDMKVAVEIGQPNPAAKALAQLGQAQEAIREVMKIDTMPEKVKEDLRDYFEAEQFKEYLIMDEDYSLYEFSNE
jgi:hypothetical protein